MKQISQEVIAMKKKFYTLSDLSPAGYDYLPEFMLSIFGLACIAFISFISFSINYGDAYNNLFIIRDPSSPSENVIMNGAMMPPFSHLIRFSTSVFLIFFAAMVLLTVNHYHYHHQGSQSIYLMRRLPDRWELFRRCAGCPIVISAAGLAVLTMLTGSYYFYYIVHTPAQCLP